MNKKSIYIIVILIVLALVVVGYFFVLKPSLDKYGGIIKEESARKNIDQKVYSVEELSRMIKSGPDYLKDKEVKVKAFAISSVPGLGCDDYSIASDIKDEDYQSYVMPEAMQSRPTINSVGIGEYGIYTGHFFDKNWIKNCNKPEMFIVTGYEKVDVNLPTLSKKETVSNGYIILRGKLLRHPYEIVLNGNDITVNGEVYESEKGNFPGRNLALESQFNYLVEDMKRGDLEIIFHKDDSGENSRGIPNVGQWNPKEIVENLDKTINSNLSNSQKKEKIKEILDDQYLDDKYLNDFLKNWNL